MKILVNGCFDRLHAGHKNLLERASMLAKGDHLLIMLNSDASIRELKGSSRPLERLENRFRGAQEFLMYGMASGRWGFECSLDIKVFSTEEELLEEMKRFKPDMIVKGDDRTDVSTITGFGLFPILVVPRSKDENGEPYSTTSLSKQSLA